jgi:predicted nucleotidyltransferase component of viral defense system
MKEECLELASKESDPGRRLNALREYAQSMTLFSLHQSEAFSSISFVGGTALRFLFALPRYSEDLGFSLESANAYEPAKWLRKSPGAISGSCILDGSSSPVC